MIKALNVRVREQISGSSEISRLRVCAAEVPKTLGNGPPFFYRPHPDTLQESRDHLSNGLELGGWWKRGRAQA